MTYTTWPVGQIASEIPGATAVLHHFNINYCGHGEKTLSEILANSPENAPVVLSALENLSQEAASTTNENDLNKTDFIDLILDRYFTIHSRQLAELIRLADRVETVHVRHPQCPIGLMKHLTQFKEQIERHMEKQEVWLFALLEQNHSGKDVVRFDAHFAEHEDQLSELEMIKHLTQGLNLHAGACNTWTALYVGLRKFINDYQKHIQLENKLFLR